jgi:hypothetical protein
MVESGSGRLGLIDSEFDSEDYELKKKQLPVNFTSGLKIVLSSINLNLNAGRRDFNIGPVYRTTTSKGLPLNVLTTYADFESAKGLIPVKGGPIGIYKLLAQDMKGDIVGVERLQIDGQNANSATYVWPRGVGIGSSLSLVFADVLQRHANKLQLPIALRFSNANLAQLNMVREEVRAGFFSTAVLEELEMEQARWQSVWGNDGRYGFKDNSRVFIPDASPVDTEVIEFIDLQRTELIQGAETVISGLATEVRVPDFNKDLLKGRRVADLRALIQRNEWVNYL